jgi:hypothetical protein
VPLRILRRVETVEASKEVACQDDGLDFVFASGSQ